MVTAAWVQNLQQTATEVKQTTRGTDSKTETGDKFSDVMEKQKLSKSPSEETKSQKAEATAADKPSKTEEELTEETAEALAGMLLAEGTIQGMAQGEDIESSKTDSIEDGNLSVALFDGDSQRAAVKIVDRTTSQVGAAEGTSEKSASQAIDNQAGLNFDSKGIAAETLDQNENSEEAQGLRDITQTTNSEGSTDTRTDNNMDAAKGIHAGIETAQSAPIQEPITSPVTETRAATFSQAVDRQETIDQLTAQMARQMQKGQTEMEISLNPTNLGSLTIKVSYEEGRAAVSILCTDKNLDIVSQSAKQIGAILENRLGQETTIVVEDQPQHSDYLQQQANEQRQQGEREQHRDRNNNPKEEAGPGSFLEQLRLGLA